MTKFRQSWILFAGLSLVTCFSVFVLPFFFPPSLSTAISVSNAAGFNNRVSAIAAAACAAGAFCLFLLLQKPQSSRGHVALDLRPLSWRSVTAVALFVGISVSCVGIFVGSSSRRYVGDSDYMIDQITSHLVYHRQLYSQIEFPYGPLLFYPPILLHALLRGALSIKQSFFIVLLLHQVTGVFLLAYLVNLFPMTRRWKRVALWCYAVFTLQPMQGPNYTLVRFALPLAILVFSTRQSRAWKTALLFLLGQVVTLTLSPEMGFAFAAGAISFSLFQVFQSGWRWLGVAIVMPVGAGLFFVIVGSPYLRMLGLFASGAYNFIVEPMPYMLLFLFGAVWLVPRMLAARLRDGAPDTALLGSCFILSLALLPVALGRADPVHVFFNGLGIFLLAMIALSVAPIRQQKVWGFLFAVTSVFGVLLIYKLSGMEFLRILRQDLYAYRSFYPIERTLRAAHRINWVSEQLSRVDHTEEEPLDISRLETIVRGDSVATPFPISMQAENMLKQHQLYRPDFYYFAVGVLDSKGEQRKISAFNEAHWALLPTKGASFNNEIQRFEKQVIGSMLTYPSKPPYLLGTVFTENLRERWELVTQIGEYNLYRNLRPE